jgi:anti-sigma regulatory factor (Ser/Thr protein kinase)
MKTPLPSTPMTSWVAKPCAAMLGALTMGRLALQEAIDFIVTHGTRATPKWFTPAR